jgi:hypothetical protein
VSGLGILMSTTVGVVSRGDAEALKLAKLLLSSLRELDPWRRLLAALISVNAWNLSYELELAWILFQLEPQFILERASPETLAYLLMGRVRNTVNALGGLYSAAKVSKELDEILSLAKREPELARELLVRKVYGLGRKGASMFLRDSGVKGLYPLDRHVLRWVYGDLTESEMCRIWASSARYREAELRFEEKSRREHAGLDPALVNILIFVQGARSLSTYTVIEYINCVKFFTQQSARRSA